jgi:hypothetical protein
MRTVISESFVYFVQQGITGPIKIGRSVKPIGRMRELQTGNPVALRLLGVERGGSRRERALQKQFSHLQVGGETGAEGFGGGMEWYRPTYELLAFITIATEAR